MAEASVASEEPSSMRLALTLGAFGILSGLLLVGAYEVTLPTIKRNDQKALRAAVLEVVPHARSMKKFVVGPTGAPRESSDDDAQGFYAAYDARGQLRGYALVGEGPGFQDVIRLIYGVGLDHRHITGLRILDSRETPGLGDKISKDLDFKKNFEHLLVEPKVVPVKKRVSTRENDVDIITGATISSTAVVSIINHANERWLPLLPAPLDTAKSLGQTSRAFAVNSRGAMP